MGEWGWIPKQHLNAGNQTMIKWFEESLKFKLMMLLISAITSSYQSSSTMIFYIRSWMPVYESTAVEPRHLCLTWLSHWVFKTLRRCLHWGYPIRMEKAQLQALQHSIIQLNSNKHMLEKKCTIEQKARKNEGKKGRLRAKRWQLSLSIFSARFFSQFGKYPDAETWKQKQNF